MKTVFQRVMSVILCVLLAFSAVSVTAFAAETTTDGSYKEYAKYSTKENIHYLLDLIDETLSQSDDLYVSETIDIGLGALNPTITLDFRSVDAICWTIDEYRTVLNTIKYMLGDLGDFDISVFEKGLKRAEDGDVKIFNELLELIKANNDLIEKFIDGTVDLGMVGEAAEIDGATLFGENGISGLIKEVIVDELYGYDYYPDDPVYIAAMDKALNDFDAFVYEDLMSFITSGTFLSGLEIEENTTIDHLITDIFAMLIDNYLIDLVDGEYYDFADAGIEYDCLNDVIVLDGEYDFTGIEFTKDKPVIDQINDVLGLIFAQVVPSYADKWVKGDYTHIGDNVRGLFRYIASETGLIKDANGNSVDIATLSDETLMLEIIKIIFYAADTNGEKEIYERIKNTETIDEMVNEIAFQLVSGDGYTYDSATQTYEHVLGDLLIAEIEYAIPLYDEKGNEITTGCGKTVWEVLNYMLNFYLVDKNLDALLGMDMDKGSTFFEKLDIILDLFADDGSADFNSEEYINALVDSILNIDLQTFVNLTVVKALNFAGNSSFVFFLYNTVYNILNNWSAGDKETALIRYSSIPFQNAMSNAGIANIVKVVVETLYKRSDALCEGISLILGIDSYIVEAVTLGTPATCTQNGTMNGKYCPTCDRVFVSSNTVIPATGHQYRSEITKKATCTENGITTYTCVVCDDSYTQTVSAHGHTLKEGVVTTKPTCTKEGVISYRCSICDTVAKTEAIPANGHTASKTAVVTKNATCTQAGTKSYNCTVCSASVRTESIPAAGHKYDSGVITTKATYTAAGVKTYTCTVCKATKTEAVKKLALGKVKDVELKTANTKTVTLTWSAVEGATGYNVQYSANNGLSWNTVTSATNSVTIKNLKAGTKIKVKVTATAGKSKSKVSNVFEFATKPAKAAIKSIASTAAKKVTVTWNAVTGANGYEVIYGSNKKITKDKKTKNVKKAKITLKKLKSGKKCFVKVRAYKTVNGEKLYGAYSKVKSVKVK